MNATLRTLADLSRDVPRHAHDPGRQQGPVDLSRGLKKLARSGFRWVVLHPELLADETTSRAHEDMLYKMLGTPENVEGKLRWSITQSAAPTD
jgi:hypothetical protein